MTDAAAQMALLVAMSRNGCIGRDNALPWHLRDDLLHFKELTSGHAIIMGRKTYDSIGKPLPRRLNIVISRQPDLQLDGCEVVASLHDACRLAETWSRDNDKRQFFVIGGAQIYKQSSQCARQLYLTVVDADIDGDAWFEMQWPEWSELSRTEFQKNDDNDWNFSILHMERKTAPQS